MDTTRFASCAMITAFLALTGCANSALEERKREEMEADIDEILSFELDPAEYGEPRSCLRDSEYQSYRALGQRHLLFQGRQKRLWVNVLRGRCFRLDDDVTFIVRPKISGRLCDKDLFGVASRSNPLRSVDSTPNCVLGEFRPVTEDQVKEIEKRLEML